MSTAAKRWVDSLRYKEASGSYSLTRRSSGQVHHDDMAPPGGGEEVLVPCGKRRRKPRGMRMGGGWSAMTGYINSSVIVIDKSKDEIDGESGGKVPDKLTDSSVGIIGVSVSYACVCWWRYNEPDVAYSDCLLIYIPEYLFFLPCCCCLFRLFLPFRIFVSCFSFCFLFGSVTFLPQSFCC